MYIDIDRPAKTFYDYMNMKFNHCWDVDLYSKEELLCKQYLVELDEIVKFKEFLNLPKLTQEYLETERRYK